VNPGRVTNLAGRAPRIVDASAWVGSWSPARPAGVPVEQLTPEGRELQECLSRIPEFVRTVAGGTLEARRAERQGIVVRDVVVDVGWWDPGRCWRDDGLSARVRRRPLGSASRLAVTGSEERWAPVEKARR
jgi:hypothetical protein